MLISPEYVQLNRELHETTTAYGKSSGKFVEPIIQLASKYDCADILDYGCGKGLLKQGIGSKVREYDPAMGKLDKSPADLVVCTDVMEHIEPEFLDEVLDDLMALTKKVAFITVCHREAGKFLSDGRNAHLIIQPPAWWLPKFMDRFNLVKYDTLPKKTFLLVLEKKNETQNS